jgi:Domain of unknown function (DUF397)
MAPPDPSALGLLSWRVARTCQGGSCVRVAPSNGMILIGDTKNPGGVLTYTASEWQEFVAGIKRGDFDDLS